MRAGVRAEVSVYVEAPPRLVYELISDVTRIGEWSPEARGCVWIGGASGPAPGAWFKGSNRRGLIRWSTKSKVLSAVEGREFSFVTFFKDHEESRWTYRLEPRNGGTVVNQTFELLADMAPSIVFMERFVLRIKDRRADLEANMRQTLERIKTSVEGRLADA